MGMREKNLPSSSGLQVRVLSPFDVCYSISNLYTYKSCLSYCILLDDTAGFDFPLSFMKQVLVSSQVMLQSRYFLH